MHITANGKEETIGADSGDPFSRYYYTLTAYDEDQSGIRQVGRYDEVTEEAIPAKARAKLGAE